MRPTSFYLIAEFIQLGDPEPQRSQGVMFEEAATRSQPDEKKAMPCMAFFVFVSNVLMAVRLLLAHPLRGAFSESRRFDKRQCANLNVAV
ncbi:hypothetical protein [Stutzerimonas stutzeri]|uniref:hypothetical protein n=1 Tax=Stutzerimonas stutzeri TaxID=316 RepID=UPI00265B3549|nr:hypothetical protein [Stutzerimonas stutzeri]MCF6781701.1 hypothetical protein [Stutzerimonas stutzeri]MCF6804370.1 hypothetical protein [Stutzerimonas stutzeri]